MRLRRTAWAQEAVPTLRVFYIDDAALNDVALTTQIVMRGNVLTNHSPYASETAEPPTPSGCGGTAIVTRLKSGITNTV